MNKLDIFKKNLPASQTEAENILWYHLRNRNTAQHKFRRQHVLQGYIVDFVCLEKKLIIELDGGQHAEQENYDNKRSLKLQSDGYTVLRFWNNEIMEDCSNVLEAIFNALDGLLDYPSPAAPRRPLPQGER